MLAAPSVPSTVIPPAPVVADRGLAIIRVASPWYAPDALIARTFRRHVGEYEALHDLEMKWYTLSDDRRYGGIYLWSAMSPMQAHFSPAWRQGVRERRGSDPDVRLWSARQVIPGAAALGGTPLGERSMYDAHAAATLTLFDQPARESALARLADVSGVPDGLAWTVVLQNEAGAAGVLQVWNSEASVKRLGSSAWLTGAARELGGYTLETYRVPVWMKPAAG